MNVDTGAIDWLLPRAHFTPICVRWWRRASGKRIMFGSDHMYWPDGIGLAIEGIETAAFLSAEQKRDIFYNNAVRFYKLTGNP